MKIKITTFNKKHHQLKISLKINNNFYGADLNYCGIISEVKNCDGWLGTEISWVSRSEIPIITALRLSQLNDEYNTVLIPGLLPLINENSPIYILKNVISFPNNKECIKLLIENSSLMGEGQYSFLRMGDKNEIIKIFKSFDYKNNLLIRAGSCLYKANILLRTSFTFSEEIYINSYIAFESLIEYLKLKYKLERKKILRMFASIGIENFEDYEEEMRDSIRNNIIHPYRIKYKQKIAQPFMAADYVLEDLGFVDWFFRQVLLRRI